MPSAPPRVFISHSRDDESWKDRLVRHLAVLGDRLDVWDDRRIRPGDDRAREIYAAVADADVAVLLISPDFLASDPIRDRQLSPILERRKSGLRIIPLIVRPCAWDLVPWLKEIQPFPPDGRLCPRWTKPRPARL